MSSNYQMVSALDLGAKPQKSLRKTLAKTLAIAMLASLVILPQAFAADSMATSFLLTINDQADAVEVESNEPFSMTVTAIDDDLETVTDYLGTISFESTDDLASLPVSYTFSEEDAGEKTFDLSFTLVEAGEHTITVSDDDDLLVFGEITLTVVGASVSTDTADLPVILTPSDGEVLNSAEVDIAGTSSANTEVSIYDGTILKGTAETDAAGNFSFTTDALFDGTHTFTVQVESGGETLTSEEIQVTVDTTAPIIQDVSLEPRSPSPGERVTVSVETETSVDEVKVVIDQRTVTLSEDAVTGSYSGNFIAPDSAGDYAIDVEVTDRSGNTDTYYDQATLTVAGTAALNASATASPTAGIAPLTVNFSTGTAASYSWNFGDGSAVSSEQNPSHIYQTPGVYTATVTVTSVDGATDSSTVAINVSSGAVTAPPQATENGPGAWALTVLVAAGLAYFTNRKILSQEI
ncbi:MAG: PKD domain-containing protein [Candidatus Gracilibacteria bacterium]|nr:PKD domain-containing protein [Candidatus Gracilibacteria bacterium]